MLKITVELIPYGIEECKETLSVVEIANVKMLKNNKADYNILYNKIAKYSIKKFDRDEGHLELVRQALEKILAKK